MASVALNRDPLKTFGDGVSAKAGGKEWPLPLASTKVSVAESGGLATVVTERRFVNAEAGPIEVTMTFPVPGDAILTGLRASIDGRDLVAVAKPSKAARQTYEDAVDAGKTAILHEEKLRGIHMLSLGNLPAGKEASVLVTYVSVLSFAGAVPTLRVPVTVGEVYGRSPLLACDDLVTGQVRLEAAVEVASDTAIPQVLGLGGASGTVVLDRSIEVAFPGWQPKGLKGGSAENKLVTVKVEPLGAGELPLDVTVLFDRSGSTGNGIDGDARRRTVFDAMQDGLHAGLDAVLRQDDRVRVAQFDTSHQVLGEARGRDALPLVKRLQRDGGGTEIGVPVIAVAKAYEGDILLLTDGKSYSLDVQAIAGLGRRVSVVLVGSDALDAAVGHVAALTGGMTYVVAGDDVASAVRSALGALRIASGNPASAAASGLPRETAVLRGGARVFLEWALTEALVPLDDVGRFAAGLVLPGLTEEAATTVAVEHGLCTHLTSLVVVDDAGEAQSGIPATRKVPLMASAADAGLLGGAPTRSLFAMAKGGATRGLVASAGRTRSMLSAGPEERASLSFSARRGPVLESLGLNDADDAGDAWTSDPSGGLLRSPGFPSGGLPPVVRPTPMPSPAPMPPAPALPPQIGEPALARMLDLRSAASRVDWDDVVARVEAEGISAFPQAVRLVLTSVAALPAVAALAKSLGVAAETLAIALLARAAGEGSRPASRLARRHLKGGAGEAEALRSVGLAA